MNTANKALELIQNSHVHIEKSIIDQYFIARTAINLKINSKKTALIGGFSISKEKQDAINTAQFETLERTLGSYVLAPSNLRDSHFCSYYVWNDSNAPKISADKILLAGTGSQGGVDAVGLAVGSNDRFAVQHAAFEFIERWLLGQIWYHDSPITKIKTRKVDAIYHVSFYTITKFEIPFVMAALSDAENNILTFGAAIKITFKEAMIKAEGEAIMLAHDFLTKKNYDYPNRQATCRRIKSQGDQGLIKKRKDKLSSLCQKNTSTFEKEYSLEKILSHLGWQKKLCYSHLHKEEDITCIRVYSEQIESLLALRKKFKSTDKFLLDPIA
jgi:hypothetical protein